MPATKLYDVLIKPLNPSFGDRGCMVEIYASTKKEAVSKARKVNHQQCYYDRLDGKLYYTVVNETRVENTAKFTWHEGDLHQVS